MGSRAALRLMPVDDCFYPPETLREIMDTGRHTQQCTRMHKHTHKQTHKCEHFRHTHTHTLIQHTHKHLALQTHTHTTHTQTSAQTIMCRLCLCCLFQGLVKHGGSDEGGRPFNSWALPSRYAVLSPTYRMLIRLPGLAISPEDQ